MNQKINLQGEATPGYFNLSTDLSHLLSIKDPPDHTEFSAGSWEKIPCDDNFAEEIIFSPPINVLSPEKITSTLLHWLSKLKKSGVLKCHLIDIKRVGKAAYNGLGLQELDQLIFGGVDRPFHSLVDSKIFEKVLQSLGFQLEVISHQGFITTIEASKC